MKNSLTPSLNIKDIKIVYLSLTLEVDENESKVFSNVVLIE
jgi:hypothetical protein